MNLDDQNLLDLNELISGAIDGRLSEPERARLQRWLRESEEARRFYVRMIELSSSLCAMASRSEAEADEDERGKPSPWSTAERLAAPAGREPARTNRRGRVAGWVLATAAAAAAFLGGMRLATQWGRPQVPAALGTETAGPDQPDDPSGESRSSGIAILTRAVDVAWEGGGPVTALGASLSKGTLRMRAGVVQLEFYGGATVVVEGPAEVALEAIDHLTCRYGKLRAHVPPRAHGFRVSSPDLDLIDLGTEFGMQVVPGRKSEVHVFDGKVELSETFPRPGHAARWELDEGHSVRFGPSGVVSERDADPPAFVSPVDLERRYIERARQRYGEWTSHAEALRNDPRLVTYFSFEGDRQPGSRLLVNQSANRSLDGAIVGCDWVDGRWPGKGALEFKRPSDRVRIHVPGEFESLTLMAWARIDAIVNRLSSLLLTDGFEPGEPHWQILSTGQIVLGIRGEPGPVYRWKNYFSPAVFTPERFGRWTHLAAVYDRQAGTVTHYVDGLALGSEAIVGREKLRIGDAELGNWGVPRETDPAPVRNLCGRMDEFALFGAALGPEEIRAFYDQGKTGL